MSSINWFCPYCQIRLQEEVGLRCEKCAFTIISRDGYFDAGQPQKLNFTPERRNHLESIERSHFWFQPRNELVKKIFSRLVSRNCRVIELGCGTGKFLPTLEKLANSVVGIDAFRSSVQSAVLRGTRATIVCGDIRKIPLGNEEFDIAVSMDVFEHVEHTVFLGEAFRIIRKGGWLLLSVPASPFLWSRVDEIAGHRCRYTPEALSQDLHAAGWELRGFTHYQCLLYPLMLISRRFFGERFSMERYPPRILNVLLGAINCCEVTLFSNIRLLWGSTLIAWAQKK